MGGNDDRLRRFDGRRNASSLTFSDDNCHLTENTVDNRRVRGKLKGDATFDTVVFSTAKKMTIWTFLIQMYYTYTKSIYFVKEKEREKV